MLKRNLIGSLQLSSYGDTQEHNYIFTPNGPSGILQINGEPFLVFPISYLTWVEGTLEFTKEDSENNESNNNKRALSISFFYKGSQITLMIYENLLH